MNEETKKLIAQIKSRLVEIYQPRSIYLFGSHVWGTPEKGSDIDLFIIVKKSNLSMTDRTRLGYRELWDIPVPLDLIVYTEKEFNEKKDHPSSLSHKILDKGLVIYEVA